MSPIEAVVLCAGLLCVCVGAFALSWQIGLILAGAAAVLCALPRGEH